MKSSFVIVGLLASLSLLAQTQTGIVKTRGRMVNGQLVRGKGIPDATVQLSDRSVLSQKSSGVFSFPVKGQVFQVKSVKKSGYQLLDPQACREYVQSRDTLYLVMDTPDQQRYDELEKERNLRRKLEKKLQEKEEEILSKNITLEEKNRLLDEINYQREQNEKIIGELAQVHATCDYDQLDDFQRRVNLLVEQCEIEQAFALLRSKGSMESRVREIRREQQIEKEEEEELARRRENLTKSKEVTRRKMADAAADCFSYYQAYLMNFQNDSAAYYLQLRASLDTTNREWVNAAGLFIKDYLADYETALAYFNTVLRHSSTQDEWMVKASNNIASVYKNMGNYKKALEYYLKNQSAVEVVFGQAHEVTAIAYSNIGGAYDDLGYFSKALEYYQKSLSVWEKVYGGKEHPDIAQIYNNIGSVHYALDNYTEAMEYYQKALAIREKAYGQDHEDVAASYNNVGSLYSDLGDNDKALAYCQKALEIWLKVYGRNHPFVATCFNNIGCIYEELEDYGKALEYCNTALAIRSRLYGADHPEVGDSYNTIGSIYFGQRDYETALEYQLKASPILEKAFGPEHPRVATVYGNIGDNYRSMGEYAKAFEYDRKALSIVEKVYGKESPRTARLYFRLGDESYLLNDYDDAVDYLQRFMETSEWERIQGTSSAESIEETLAVAEYMVALSDDTLPAFNENHCFTVSLDGAAFSNGLWQNGDVILLEYDDWTPSSNVSVFEKNAQSGYQSKIITTLEDGEISKIMFDEGVRVRVGIKRLDRQEKQRIDTAYSEWKSKRKQKSAVNQ